MTTPDLPAAVQRSWHRFLETYEPLRPELYRYCRHLTRSPWDAEDLAQDALASAFATLARMGGQAPASPRAWLFRVASNLWIDAVRRRREPPAEEREPGQAGGSERREPREAAGTLIARLSPQERAAVVLKDAFDLSLEEVAEVLGTSAGAVKAALHRGRGKLADEAAPEPEVAPLPAALDAFCAAFAAGDLDRLAALLLDAAVVEVAGATTQYGPEAARRTVLTGLLFGSRRLADPDARGGVEPRFRAGALPDLPRCQALRHRGRWLTLHWYRHVDGEAVRGVTTYELEGDRVARLRNYFYSPELLVELGAELQLPIRVNGYRWWAPEAP